MANSKASLIAVTGLLFFGPRWRLLSRTFSSEASTSFFQDAVRFKLYAVTSILRGLAVAILGRVTLRTPAFIVALIFSKSTSAPSSKAR